eukprot:4837141-Pleurochrysis_carterae.AAC.1
MVSARSVAPVLLRCREPHCRMNSAKSASVSWLYRAPPGSPGSTKGVRSVVARKSANHSSAVTVLPTDAASVTRVRTPTRRRARLAVAASEGCSPVHLSGIVLPSAPVIPTAAARAASSAAVALR